MDVKFGIEHGTNSSFILMKTDTYLKSIKYAESVGYDSVFIMDHLNHTPPRAEIPSCNVLLGWAAAETKNIEIGSSVTDPHRKHPAQIALDSLTMQRITENRFILGIGTGEGMNLTDFGVQWNKPVKRLKEAIEVIKLLWKTSQSRKLTVNYSGEFYNLKNARLQYPTKVLPKLWIAANGPKMIEFAGKHADGWIPINYSPKLYKKHLTQLRKAGRIDEIVKACEIFVFISDENPDKAHEVGRTVGASICLNPELLDDYNITISEELNSQQVFKLPMTELLKYTDKLRDYALENIPEDIIEAVIIAGSSDEVIEQICEYTDAGAEYFIIELFGLGNYFDALDLFTNKVFSYFKGTDKVIQ
ncbi:MAG: LLM class flavin-dependent oxidoreductase [Candidatus Hodarchaeota archaeon]